MTVKDLITELMENCNSLEDDVELYVCAKTDAIEDYLKAAEGGTWCLDEILCIDEVEDRGGHIWLKAEEIK